jgi:TetR/AcrR family transcriptional regulator, fatty acid metabolism regulator protein
MRTKNKPGGQISPSFIEIARRAQIIECAIETIATLGYAQASLAQIAKRAGISKGVITYHFAGKDELIEQIIPEIYAAGARFMVPQIEAQSTAASMLRVYIQANIQFIHTHRVQMMAVMEIMTNFRTQDGHLRFDVHAEEPALAALERILSFGQHSGEFRSFDMRVMALTIRRAIDALPPLITAFPDLNVTSYTQELVTLFDRATRKEEDMAEKEQA